MKWSVIGIDRKGIWIDWGWYDSWGDADNGESYEFNMPKEWWQQSFDNAKDNWEYHKGFLCLMIPSFLVYFIKPIATIKDFIRQAKYYFEGRKNIKKCNERLLRYEKEQK